MTIHQQILQLLTEVGEEGISVQNLARHVYNMNVTFFDAPDYDKIRTVVQQYLLANSKSSTSLLEHMERRGYYRLNTQGCPDARQLQIDFFAKESTDQEDTRSENTSQPDLSLSLFSDDDF